MVLPTVVAWVYRGHGNKSPAFYLLSLSGVALYVCILCRCINPQFTKSDSFRLEGIIPTLYALTFISLILFYASGWYFLGNYNGHQCSDGDCDFKEAFYFSVATSTTVGYGDFFPKTDAARIFASIQVLTSLFHGLFGLAFLMRHLVAPGSTSYVFYRELSDKKSNLKISKKIKREPIETWHEKVGDLRQTGKRHAYSVDQGKENSWLEI
ncbi:ion channel [Trinickia dabaoshanensis]|nr:ion channel [Trinickia dabaoshanensis]